MTYSFHFKRPRDGATRTLTAANFTEAVNRLATEKPDPQGPFNFDHATDANGAEVSPFTLAPCTGA